MNTTKKANGGIVAFLLVFALVMVGCGDGTGNPGETIYEEYSKLTISSMPGISKRVWIFESGTVTLNIAAFEDAVNTKKYLARASNSNDFFYLSSGTSVPWRGSGDFLVLVYIRSFPSSPDYANYYHYATATVKFTNGRAWTRWSDFTQLPHEKDQADFW